MTTWEDIKNLATTKATTCGGAYEDRIIFELDEIEKQTAGIKWENYYNDNKKFDSNPNGLLLPWLLGMVKNDPINTELMLNTSKASKINEFKIKHGCLPIGIIRDTDMPDIDLDCLPEARDPIKEYATKKYGAGITDGYGPVCSVGTWQTYKFKNALADACVGTGAVSRSDAFKLTTSLPDDVDQLKDGGMAICKGIIIENEIKTECKTVHGETTCPNCGSADTDGPTIGKLLEEHSQLKLFEQEHKLIVNYAVQLIGRIRNMGMHAGALIIADRSLYGNIPMAKSSNKGHLISMWTEGRNVQLSKFGYCKWDILGLKTLKYIFECCKLIEKNRGISFGEHHQVYRIKLKNGDEHIVGDGESVDVDGEQTPIRELFKLFNAKI